MRLLPLREGTLGSFHTAFSDGCSEIAVPHIIDRSAAALIGTFHPEAVAIACIATMTSTTAVK